MRVAELAASAASFLICAFASRTSERTISSTLHTMSATTAETGLSSVRDMVRFSIRFERPERLEIRRPPPGAAIEPGDASRCPPNPASFAAYHGTRCRWPMNRLYRPLISRLQRGPRRRRGPGPDREWHRRRHAICRRWVVWWHPPGWRLYRQTRRPAA